jgi:glucose/arabinose dehydrogenase
MIFQPWQWRRNHALRARSIVASLTVLLGDFVVPVAALTVDAPNLNPELLRITIFASGLNYPVGMAELDDGSILVAITTGASYFGSTAGSVMRLADTDNDGVADQQQTLVANVPGGRLSALRRAGPLVAVTGQGSGSPITLYRLGQNPADPLAYLGQLDLTYPTGGWLHPHSALALRQDPVDPLHYELYFQLGSKANFAETTATVSLSGNLGLTATLAGDAVHRIDLIDGPNGLSATAITKIATGLRNPTGLAVDPATGDLYVGDNGIDGLVDANEPLSADEINMIPAADLGTMVPDFGFPNTYEAYRTGITVGSEGVLPLATFQPIPAPNGSEAEGVNEIAFAPALFPAPLANGLFAGFHGRFNLAGIPNEENPVAFLNLADHSYFHFVPNSDPTVGHLDSLLPTTSTLYMADISSQGGFSGTALNSGAIYAIHSLIQPGDYDRDGDTDGQDMLLWQRDLGKAVPPFAAADGDGNRLVDAADLSIWRAQFNTVVPGNSIPEPCGIYSSALAIAILVAIRGKDHKRQARRAPAAI